MIKIESFGIIPLQLIDGAWRVLLILHKEGSHWSFPKGRPHTGESSQESAVRELKEETGLDVVKLLKPDPYVEQYQFRNKREIFVKTVYYYPAIVGGTLVLQEEEIRDSLWLTLSEAIDRLSFKEAKNICRQVIELLQTLKGS